MAIPILTNPHNCIWFAQQLGSLLFSRCPLASSSERDLSNWLVTVYLSNAPPLLRHLVQLLYHCCCCCVSHGWWEERDPDSESTECAWVSQQLISSTTHKKPVAPWTQQRFVNPQPRQPHWYYKMNPRDTGCDDPHHVQSHFFPGSRSGDSSRFFAPSLPFAFIPTSTP